MEARRHVLIFVLSSTSSTSSDRSPQVWGSPSCNFFFVWKDPPRLARALGSRFVLVVGASAYSFLTSGHRSSSFSFHPNWSLGKRVCFVCGCSRIHVCFQDQVHLGASYCAFDGVWVRSDLLHLQPLAEVEILCGLPLGFGAADRAQLTVAELFVAILQRSFFFFLNAFASSPSSRC